MANRLDNQIKTLKRIKRQQQKGLQHLSVGDHPRYVVWYWIYDSKRQNCSIFLHYQTNNLDEALRKGCVATGQACISSENPVYIRDRVDGTDIRV